MLNLAPSRKLTGMNRAWGIVISLEAYGIEIAFLIKIFDTKSDTVYQK